MSKREVLLALGAAGLVNMPMSAMAAVAFHNGAHHQTAEIETAYWTLAPLLGAGAAGLFRLALLASSFFQLRCRGHGRPGDHAGLCIIPYPDLASPPRRDDAVVCCHQRRHTHHACCGAEPGGFGLVLPNPMVALVRLTAKRDVMGEFANSRLTNAVAVAATAFVSALNAVLLLGIMGLWIP